MRRAIEVVGCFSAFTAVFAGAYLLLDYTIGRPLQPVWGYWISGALFGALIVSERAGWLRGVLVDPRRRQELKERQAGLADERERILSEERLKLRRAEGQGRAG